MEQSSNSDPVNNDPVNNDQLPRQAGPFKIILVGEPGVGKTWFVHRAVTGTPPNKTLPVTLTAQAFTKKVHISSNVEVTLEIWDTAGQERFNSLTNSYYRGAAAVLAVYDADHKHSIEVTLKDIRSHMFDHGPRSYSLYQPHLNYGSASPLVFLLATKTDLFHSSPHNPTQRPNTPRGDRHGSAADASTCNSATSTASNPATTPAASNPAAATEASCPKELALSDNEIQTLCKRNSVLISGAFCVSSKSGENVEETVRGIAELIVKAKYPENTSFEDSIKLHINELKTNDTKCGC